jgi:hypothetical protein
MKNMDIYLKKAVNEPLVNINNSTDANIPYSENWKLTKPSKSASPIDKGF